MTAKRYRRKTVFPGSDPDILLRESASLYDYINLILYKTLVLPREAYIKSKTISRKVKPIAQIGIFILGPISYNITTKNTTINRLKNRLENK